MQFSQKYTVYKTMFDFGEEELTYSFDNSRKKAGASIPYHKISTRITYKKDTLWDVKYIFLLCLLFCITMAIYAWGVAGDARFFMMTGFVPVLACVYMLGRFTRRPIGITTILANPPLCVLKDQQHAAILEEISRRRREQIRKKLAQVDFDKPYYEESRKFNWLKEEGFISEQELAYARQKIVAMRSKATIFPLTTNDVH